MTEEKRGPVVGMMVTTTKYDGRPFAMAGITADMTRSFVRENATCEVFCDSGPWEPTPGSWDAEPDLEIRLEPRVAGRVVGLAISGYTIGVEGLFRGKTRIYNRRELFSPRFMVKDITIGGRRQFIAQEERAGCKLQHAPEHLGRATERGDPGYELDDIRADEAITVVVVCAEPLSRFRLQAWIKHDE